MPRVLQAQLLERAAYAPFGDVIEAAGAAEPANDGSARRFNRLAALENRRPGAAAPNVCVFRVTPVEGNPVPLRALERHPESTQLFVPMAGAARYLVVVAPGAEAPRVEGLRAFVARAGQGISYRPGTWHHPLLALDAVTDFTCLVHEAGDAGDVEIRPLTGWSVRY